MRPSNLLSSVLLFALTCSAWPTGLDRALDAVKQEIAPLYNKRASPESSTSSVDDKTVTSTSSSTESSDAKTTSTDTDTHTTGKTTATGTSKTTTGRGSEATTKTFNAEDPAGGVTMISPAATDPASYYKIKDQVTFAWNYTSLQATPSYVDILASCSVNQATYTIALNQSVTGPTQAVTWDTGAYQATATVPLLTETYTLIIYDAQKPITAVPSPGYLSTYSQFTFGMYLPQAYTPLNEYICATCNGAMSAAERQTLWFLFGTAGLTVLSFGWFTGVAGLW